MEPLPESDYLSIHEWLCRVDDLAVPRLEAVSHLRVAVKREKA
jgi:hypothetical protein